MSTVASIATPRAVDLRFLAIVGVGGAVGSMLRHTALLAVDDPTLAIFLLNVVGSLMLGSLSGWLAHRLQSGLPTTAKWSALIGLGFCGGLTTFSAHAADIAQGLRQSTSASGIASAIMSGLGTAFVAVSAAAVGFELVRRTRVDVEAAA